MAVSTSSSSSPRTLRIGIIGFGPFGQFLAKTMMKQGHILSATSRTDHSQLCQHLGLSFFRDVRAFLESDNDVLLISTSILSLSEVLESLPFHCIKRPTLIADVLSVKEYPKNVLLKVINIAKTRDKNLPIIFSLVIEQVRITLYLLLSQVLPEVIDVLCTHPMFGPQSGKDGWTDLAFVYEKVRIRDEATCSSFLHIFESEGCKMLEMSCEEHDKLAAKSQFLSHTIGRVLSEMEIQSTSMNTKGFESLLQLKESSVRDSFNLFSGLFIHNRFAMQELQNLELALEKVKQKLQQRM